MIVTVVHDLIHEGRKVRAGSTVNMVSTTARELRARGLVTFGGVPSAPLEQTAGGPSSASQADQAAPQTTSGESDAGVKKKRRKRLAAE